MSFRPFLLRVFLILALVLNGTTAAAGAVTMGNAQATASDAESTSAPASGHACHEGMEAMPVADEPPQQARTDPPQHPAPDCCHQSSCSCACMGAQAGAPSSSDGSIAPRSERLMPALARGHLEPATLHLIRPPIG